MKTKKYLELMFPNKLSPLETYFYYLKEFGVIPKKLSVDVIKNIFDSSVSDYFNKNIDENILSVVTSNLYFSGDAPEIIDKEDQNLSWLMSFVCELSWDKKENTERYMQTTKYLKMYLEDKKRFEKEISDLLLHKD